MVVFLKSPNNNPMAVYNIPSGSHLAAYSRNDISSVLNFNYHMYAPEL